MKAIRSHHLSRRTCLALIAMIVSGLAAPGLSSVWAAPAMSTVLVFPVSNAAENAPADIGARATGAVALAIDDTPGFDASQFLSTSPSVQRAVSEGRIRKVDVEEGARDLGTALHMGAALQADYIVTASVQSYTVKSTPASVELILAGQMYEVGANINPATGEPVAEPKVLRAFGVSGASTPRAKYNGSENALAQEALRNAAAKAAQTLSGRTDVAEVAVAKKSERGAYKWVILALLLGGLALAVNSGGGDAPPGPSPDALPPRNVTVEPTEDAIQLQWEEPTGTTLTVLRYQIDRAVDGGPFSRIDPGSLGPGRTFFFDYELLTGRHAYQYRMRTIYTSGDVSPYVITGTTVVTR